MAHLGKLLILAGAVLVGIGILLVVANRIPFLGRLPGDVAVERKSFSFYFPITTCLVLSALISLLLWLFGRK